MLKVAKKKIKKKRKPTKKRKKNSFYVSKFFTADKTQLLHVYSSFTSSTAKLGVRPFILRRK